MGILSVAWSGFTDLNISLFSVQIEIKEGST